MFVNHFKIATVFLAVSGASELATAQAVFLDSGRVAATGTDAANVIVISPDNDKIRVVIDGAQTTFVVAEVQDISIDSMGGDDLITIEVNLPTVILAGAGNDTIVGSDGGADFVNGQQGVDTFKGRGGDDVFIWNPGDGNDIINGDDGNDTHIFNGAGADEIMVIAPNAGRVRLTRNLGNIVMDIGTFENITVNALGGNDTVSGAEGLAALQVKLTVDGGAGDDILNGGDGDDLLLGGDGHDTIDGNRGVDRALMGTGDDVFIWDPGDGSDFVEGELGRDTMLFNGAAGNEVFDASADGSRLRFFRNPGNIIMDVGTTERIDLRTMGGNDATTINDLVGTGVTEVIVDAGPGNDSFVGSSLREIFLGGEGDDTATFGEGDILDMGAGIDALLFFGTSGRDNIHINAITVYDQVEASFRIADSEQRAVFDNGEVVTVFTQGDDKVKAHKRATNLWNVQVIE